MAKMIISEGLAELYGAMMGDGCLSEYFSDYDKRKKFCVLLTGHTHDEPYYKQVIQPIFLNEFGIPGCIRFRNDCNAVRFETVSLRIFNFFTALGFPVGKKLCLQIPPTIYQTKTLALACIRGIFDTDGSVYRRYSKKYKPHKKEYTYLNVQFKMNSQETISQLKNILNSVGINTGNITKKNKAYELTIFNQQAVHSFFTIVKPSNPYHIERFLNLRRKNLKVGS